MSSTYPYVLFDTAVFKGYIIKKKIKYYTQKLILNKKFTEQLLLIKKFNFTYKTGQKQLE